MRPTAQGNESHKILVVDDNAASAQTMAMLLQMAGHNVIVAETGGAALQECAHFDPDVVLLDIGLPDRDWVGAGGYAPRVWRLYRI